MTDFPTDGELALVKFTGEGFKPELLGPESTWKDESNALSSLLNDKKGGEKGPPDEPDATSRTTAQTSTKIAEVVQKSPSEDSKPPSTIRPIKLIAPAGSRVSRAATYNEEVKQDTKLETSEDPLLKTIQVVKKTPEQSTNKKAPKRRQDSPPIASSSLTETKQEQKLVRQPLKKEEIVSLIQSGQVTSGPTKSDNHQPPIKMNPTSFATTEEMFLSNNVGDVSVKMLGNLRRLIREKQDQAKQELLDQYQLSFSKNQAQMGGVMTGIQDVGSKTDQILSILLAMRSEKDLEKSKIPLTAPNEEYERGLQEGITRGLKFLKASIGQKVFRNQEDLIKNLDQPDMVAKMGNYLFSLEENLKFKHVTNFWSTGKKM